MPKAPSLAAQSGALTKPFEMPSVFGAPDPIKPRQIAPYITFAHNKRADEYKRIVEKFGIPDEGTMFLIEPDKVTKLDPAKLMWVHHQQLWVEKDTTGKLTATSFKEMPDWKETIEAVVMVILDDRIVPANVQFRTTKCAAASKMANALAECQTPAWAEKSPQHRETLVIANPNFRFYGEVSIAPARTGSSGNVYRSTTCDIKPMLEGSKEHALLEKTLADPAFKERMEAAGKRYQSQIASFRDPKVMKQ